MKVGDYVRTKYGISKIENISPNDYDKEHDYVELENFVFDGLDAQGFFTTDEIIKSSPNIKDVLEEHDFVQMQDRGNSFYEIERDYTGKLSLRDIGWDEYEELDETNIPEIVSIITHEQMEQMKYKVGD